MNQLLLGNLIMLLLLSACGRHFGFGSAGHCSQYTYSNERQVWIDAAGKRVNCTIVDNNRIFPYYPEKGCDYWREFYQLDETVKFVELPIKIGSGKQIIAQTYCVKQVYINNTDHSGQVLLIDEGIFCFREHPGGGEGYVFTSCTGVKKKAPETETNKE